MTRPKDRASATGLLPRMEARPRKDGLVTYRYHPLGKTPVSLGTDKAAALRKVLDINNEAPDRGSVAGLWRLYQETADWQRLADNSQIDYRQCSKALLKVFGPMAAADVLPSHCARYLRVERASAPKRANREMALMSNLMNLAIERGDILANPCKQIRRNHESPRKDAPEPGTVVDFLAWARARTGQAQVLANMAEFAALTGNRRIEFLNLHWPQVGEAEIRLIRGKQRDRPVVEVVAVSPALDTLLQRMRATAANDRLGTVFPNRVGNPYTEAGFKAMWSKLVGKAVAEKAIEKRFTFHDLRAYYVTQHKIQCGALPDLHANPGTTARVYDRAKEVKRKSL
jgi:integrase